MCVFVRHIGQPLAFFTPSPPRTTLGTIGDRSSVVFLGVEPGYPVIESFMFYVLYCSVVFYRVLPGTTGSAERDHF
jgi:hypothetical protein